MHAADDAAGSQIVSGTRVACKLEEAATTERTASFTPGPVVSYSPGPVVTQVVERNAPRRARSLSSDARQRGPSPIVVRPVSPHERSPVVARAFPSQESVCARPVLPSVFSTPAQATRLCSSNPVLLDSRTGTPVLTSRSERDQSAGAAIVTASVATSTLISGLSAPRPPQCTGAVRLSAESAILHTPTLVPRELPPRSAGSVRLRVLSPVAGPPRGGTCQLPVGSLGGATCSLPCGGSRCSLHAMPRTVAPPLDPSRAQSSDAAGMVAPSSPTLSLRVLAIPTGPSSARGSCTNGFHATQRVASLERQEAQDRERAHSSSAINGAHRSRSVEIASGPSSNSALHGHVPRASRSSSPPALTSMRQVPQQAFERLENASSWQFKSQQGLTLEKLISEVVPRRTPTSLAARARVEIPKGVAQAQFDSELDDGDMTLEPASASPALESNLSELDSSGGHAAVGRLEGTAAPPVPNFGNQIKYIPNAIKYINSPNDFVIPPVLPPFAGAWATFDSLQIPREFDRNSVNHVRVGSELEANGSRKHEKGVVINDTPSDERQGSAHRDSEGSINGSPCSRASGAALIRRLSLILNDDDASLDSDSGSPPWSPKRRETRKLSKSPTRTCASRMSSGASLESVPEKDTDTESVDCTPRVRVPSDLGRALFAAALTTAVTAKKARHPERARVGRILLEHSAPELTANGLTKDADAELVKRLFFDSMPESLVRIQSIEQVISPKLLKRFLKVVAEEVGAVEATFHGTKPDLAEKIVSTGLSTDICQTGAYGLGAYVGTHAGVAHQYADADKDGRRYMCLVLVVAGKQVVKGQQGEQPKATALDNLSNPTLYCFVDKERLLVSHLITYTAQMSARKRIGGGWHDPFQTKLSGAVRRTAQRSRKHGSR